MSYFNNQIRAGWRSVVQKNGIASVSRTGWSVLWLSVLLLVSATIARAQQPVLPPITTTCDYASEPASISLTAQNVPIGYSTLYLLVNRMSGKIVQTNPFAPVFGGVARGLYYAVAAHYKASLNGVQVGNLISEIYATDQCLTYGTALSLKVCAPGCDYNPAPTLVSFTAQSVPPGVTTTYVLTDVATEQILQTSSVNSFSNVPAGEFAITSVHYTGSLTALTAGNRLYDVTTQNENCLSVSNTLYVTVCNSPIAITGPADGATVVSLNPPVSGTATPGSSVTVTGVPGSTGGPVVVQADPITGAWSTTALTFPAGPNSVSATDGLTSAVSNFTTLAPNPPTISIDSPTPNALVSTTNIPVSGTATPGSSVVLTDANNNVLCSTTATAGGSYSCLINLPPGSNTITATASTTGGTTTTSTQVTAVSPPTVVFTNPFDGAVIASQSAPAFGISTPGASLTILGPNSQSCTTTAEAVSGTFTCGNFAFTPGQNSLSAIASNAGGTATNTTTFTVLAPSTISIDSPNNIVASTNPPVSGTATPGASVSVLGPNGQVCTTVADLTTGAYSCNSLTFAAGPASVTALAGPVNGSNPSTPAVASFTAVGPPSLTVAQPVTPGPLTQLVSGTATPGSVISITDPTGATLCSTTAISGTFACPVSVTAGVTTLTVTASGPGGVTTQPVTLTAVDVPTVAINSPNNTTATTTPTISGTATPGSTVTLTASNGSSVTALADPTDGSYTATMPTAFPAGPASITAVATNAGGSSTPAVASFTAVAPVGPPSLTVAQPTPGPLTQLVSGTATPGSVITITDPTGVTLCSTVATSGTFACPVTLTSGVNPLTVTASGPGGSTTAPVTFTAVDVPTVTINSPANGGTVASLNPPVSGMAMPNSSVTVLGPNSQSCVTTAANDGSYTCTSLTFVNGPSSVTALASNAGGVSSPAISNFTVAVPPTVAIQSPANNAVVASTNPPISGTATPGSSVTVSAPGNTPCVVTADMITGAYTCTSLTFANGTTPSVTAVTGKDGLASTPAVNSFSISLPVTPPTVAIDSPANGGTVASLNPPVSGTATPGSTVTVTAGPGSTGGPLVVTTDPTTGVWSTTAITFPNGPASVTAIAGNGTTTSSPATSNFTVAVPPTVAINSPNNTTATTTPTVSGTATPGSSVTLTASNGSSITALANPTDGSYMAVLSTAFPDGPASVTAIASNASGVSSPVTANFTVVAPASLIINSPANNGTVSSTNPVVSGTATPGSSVTVLGPNGQSCITTAANDGSYSCTSLTFANGQPASVTALACTSGGCSSVVSSFTVAEPPTVAINSPNNTTATATPTISGTATPNAVVTLDGGPDSVGGPVSVTADNTGAYSTSAITFPAGPVSVTAVAVNEGGTSTPAVASFTVVGPPSLTVAQPVTPGPLTQLVSGTATPGSVISITDPTGASLCSTTATSGTFACPVSVTAGVTTLTVTASGPGGTTTQPVTFTAVDVPTVAINSPTNTTATTTPTISGTATPNAVVTLDGGPGSVGGPVSVTADNTGAYSTSALTFPAGPNSVTAIAVNEGGTSTPAVASFTAVAPVGPPSLTVAQPTPGPLTQLVSGTATPGSVITITDPTGATLCSTTATSGTFACPVTLTSGVNPLTVTASGPGGITSVPVTFTAVAAPAIVILSPANSTTQPAGTNTVSGTATAGSMVMLTTSTGSFTTTANATTGAYSVSGLTFATGTNTVTVVATNAGGMTSATSTFTIVGATVLAPDLALTFGVPTPAPTAGQVSYFPVTVTNMGTASASGALLYQMMIPAGLTYNINTYAAGNDWTCTVVGSVMGCTNPNTGGLAASASTTFSFRLQPATSTQGQSLTLTGTVNVVAGETVLTNNTATQAFTVGGNAISLPIRAFLQGALTSTTTVATMRDDLRTKGVLPTTEPYTSLGYTHLGGGGSEATTNAVFSVTGTNAIVDWVVVELRNAAIPTQILATRSGLLQRDGDVVDMDGVTSLTFGAGASAGTSYFVSVHHRNHLGVMTATALPLSTTNTVVDFTSTSTAVYQFPVGDGRRSSAPLASEGGLPALWAGNTTGDARVILQGPDNDVDPIFFDVVSDLANTQGLTNFIRANIYSLNDVNMDGHVIFQGPENEVDSIFFEILSHPDNADQFINFIIQAQIP